MVETTPAISESQKSAAHLAGRQAVDYAVDLAKATGGYPTPEVTKMRRLERVTRHGKDLLLGIIDDVAIFTMENGLDIDGIASEIRNRTAGELSKTARLRIKRELGKKTGTTTSPRELQALWKDIMEMDPADITLKNRRSDGTKHNPSELKVTRSMGLNGNQEVDFIPVKQNLAFEAVAGDPSNIRVGNLVVEKVYLHQVLMGKERFKPMWRRNGAAVPIEGLDLQQKKTIFLLGLNGEQSWQLLNLLNQDVYVQQELNRFPYEQIPVTGFGLESTDGHKIHDCYDQALIKDANGKTVGLRVVVTDGAGGSFEGQQLDQAQKDHLIQERSHQLTKDATQAGDVLPDKALKQAEKKALQDEKQTGNNASAALAMVDLRNEGIHYASKGDCGIVLWNENEYRCHRSHKWQKQGGQSPFYLLNYLQNLAFRLWDIGQDATPETQLDDHPQAHVMYSGAPDLNDPVDQDFYPKENLQADFMLIMTDGGRPGSALLVPGNPYHQEVNRILTDLAHGKISSGESREKQILEAERQIAWASRNINQDSDDITVRIVDLREYLAKK